MDCLAAKFDLPAAVKLLGGKQGSKRKSYAEKVLKVFKAMASTSEMAIFKDPQSAAGVIKETVKQARCCVCPAPPASHMVTPSVCCAQILKLIIHRVVDSFRENGINVPRDIYKGHTIGFNKVCDNVRDSKVDVSASEFAAWRVKRDTRDVGGSEPLGPASPPAALGKRSVTSVDYEGQDEDEPVQ